SGSFEEFSLLGRQIRRRRLFLSAALRLGGGRGGVLVSRVDIGRLGSGAFRLLLAKAEALFFAGALGVEDVEAVDDFVFEGLKGAASGVGDGAVGRDGDVAPAVGVEDRAFHGFMKAAKLEDARVVAGRILEGV